MAQKKKSEKYREIAEKMVQEAGVEKVVENRTRLHGCAFVKRREIQVPPPTTLRRLQIFAHECGHVARAHSSQKPRHREEYEAETWSREAFKRHGLKIPPASEEVGRRYVAYKIRQAVRRGAKQIDPEAVEFAREYLDSRTRQLLEHLTWNVDGSVMTAYVGRTQFTIKPAGPGYVLLSDWSETFVGWYSTLTDAKSAASKSTL
jgi:hypothetical protein